MIQCADMTKAIYVCAIFYNFVLGMVKLSVLALYLRIIRGVQSQSIRALVWGVVVLVSLNTAINVGIAVFGCWPIQAQWDVRIPANQKRCVHSHKRDLEMLTVSDASISMLSTLATQSRA
jgi:hypothetical protein